MKITNIFFMSVWGVLILFVSIGSAANYTFTWDKPDKNDNVAEYMIFYRMNSGIYDIDNYPLTQGLLYSAEDYDSIIEDITFTKEFNTSVRVVGCLTWQAGLGRGFVPARESVPQFKYPKTYFDKFILFITVGPLVLLECAVGSFYNFFIILVIIDLVIFVIKREFIILVWWWDDFEQ